MCGKRIFWNDQEYEVVLQRENERAWFAYQQRRNKIALCKHFVVINTREIGKLKDKPEGR